MKKVLIIVLGLLIATPCFAQSCIWTDNPKGPACPILPQNSNVPLGSSTQAFSSIHVKPTGTFIANGTSAVTISDTQLTANSVVVFGLKTAGGTPAPVYVDSVTPGTGFTVKSSSGNTSTYNYLVID